MESLVQTLEKYGAENIKVYTSTFTNLWYGPWQMEPDDKPKTAMKLVTLLPTERVVGLHCIGKSEHKDQYPETVISSRRFRLTKFFLRLRSQDLAQMSYSKVSPWR